MEWPWQPGLQGRTVWLIRHGRTAWNAQGRFLGRTDVPLDEVGWAEAEALRPLGPQLDRVWTSPLSRARETASVLGRAQVVPDLAELDQGELEGVVYPEALARWPEFFTAFGRDPTDAIVPGGESLGAVQARAMSVLDQVRAGDTAIVSHQMVIASIRCAIAGEPLRRWRHFRSPNTGITVLRDPGDGWREEVGGWLAPGPGGRTV